VTSGASDIPVVVRLDGRLEQADIEAAAAGIRLAGAAGRSVTLDLSRAETLPADAAAVLCAAAACVERAGRELVVVVSADPPKAVVFGKLWRLWEDSRDRFDISSGERQSTVELDPALASCR